MGLDLKIYPLKSPQKLNEVEVFCYDCLSFERDDDIFLQLKDLGEGNVPTIKVLPIPPQMWIVPLGLENPSNNKVRTDNYNDELTFVYAQQLKKLKVSHYKNKAIIAFISELPDDIPIILWWH